MKEVREEVREEVRRWKKWKWNIEEVKMKNMLLGRL
jgi:hypothetical protein